MSDATFTGSPQWMRVAAAICLAMSVITLATLIPALIEPPAWNRVDRLIAAWAWFYVGYIHWRLAQVLAAEKAEEGRR